MENKIILSELERKALSFPEKAKQALVKDAETLKGANELLLAIRTMQREISDTFGPIIKRAHEAHRQAIEQKKKYEEPLSQAERIIKGEIGRYMREQMQIRMEAEEKARREREEAEKKRLEALEAAIEAEKKGENEKADEILSEEFPEPLKQVIPEPVKIPGTFLRKFVRWRVVELDKVPREYLEVNEVKIQREVSSKGLQTAIPGIEVYSEEIVVSRNQE